MLDTVTQQPAIPAAPPSSAEKALSAKTGRENAETRAAERGSFAEALESAAGGETADQTAKTADKDIVATTADGAPALKADGVARSDTAEMDLAITLEEVAPNAEPASQTPDVSAESINTLVPQNADETDIQSAQTAPVATPDELPDGKVDDKPTTDIAIDSETPETGDTALAAQTRSHTDALAGDKTAHSQSDDAADVAASQLDQDGTGAEAVIAASAASAAQQPATPIDKRTSPAAKAGPAAAHAALETGEPAPRVTGAQVATTSTLEEAAATPSRYAAQVEGDSAVDEKLLTNQPANSADKTALKSTAASFETLLAAQTEPNSADPALTVSFSKAPSADSIAATKPLPEVMVQVPQQRAEMAAKQVGLELARQAKNGDTHFVIRMDPPELGKLDVRLTINKAGEVQANILVDREATLDLLARDTRGLERSLQDAGLKFDQSALNLGLKQNSDNTDADQSLANAQGGSSGDGSDDADSLEEIIDGAALAQIQLASGRPLDVII